MITPDNLRNARSHDDFIRLLLRHEPALRAYSRSMLPNWQLVDEVIQEASVTLWEKFDQLQEEAGFLPWAKVVVRFKCLSAIDRLRRDRHVFSEGVLEMLADEAETFDVNERVKSIGALRVCLGNFSQAHQELLLAPYAGEGRVLLLARQVGKSANSFYKLLGRLREKLAECILTRLQQEAR